MREAVALRSMTGPPRRRPSRAETRRRIVDAATAVFARQGIAATSLNDVAAEAGARLLAGIDSDTTWHRLLLEYWGLAIRNPAVHKGLAERRARLREAVTAAIGKVADLHGIKLPLAPEHLAVVVLALSNGLAVERGVDPDAVPSSLFGDVLKLLVTPQPADV